MVISDIVVKVKKLSDFLKEALLMLQKKSKREQIEERVLEVAKYISNTKETVRGAARKFGISKSTVHRDMVYRLPKISPELFEQVRNVLDVNKAERHIRGGISTKMKYQIMKHK